MPNLLWVLCLGAIFAWGNSMAANLKIEVQDVKLPSQQMLEKQTMSAPEAADDNQILDDNAGGGSAGATVTTFLAQPDVARNVTVTPGGSTGDVKAGTVTVTGTDLFGAVITESLALTDNLSTVVAGNKAFKTVTSVAFPAEDAPYAATFDVGTGDKLGVKRCMNAAGHVVFATLGGVYEATRPTVAADASVVSANTVDLNSALDGSDVEVFFVQNYRCLP